MLRACGCPACVSTALAPSFYAAGFLPSLRKRQKNPRETSRATKKPPNGTKGAQQLPTSRPTDHLGAPRGPQETPNAPQRTPEGHQKTTWRHQGAPKRHPKHPKGPQRASKRPPRAPKGTPKVNKKSPKWLPGTPLEPGSLYLGRPLESTVPAKQNSPRHEPVTT